MNRPTNISRKGKQAVVPARRFNGCTAYKAQRSYTSGKGGAEMSKPKRYELHTADLLAIPEDRFDDFLIDLKKWHKACRDTIELLNTIADAVGEDKVPAELAKMVWIDDGKHDGKVIIKSPTNISKKGQ